MASHSLAEVSMYSALDKLLQNMNMHGHFDQPSTVAIQLACRPMDSWKLRAIIHAIPESESVMKTQSYIYGTDEEIQLLLKIRAGLRLYAFMMNDTYSYLMRFKENHNLEDLHLYVRCIIAVYESLYHKTLSRPSSPVSPSSSSESRRSSSHARSRSRESQRPQTSRGRHHATHDTPAGTHRQRSRSKSHDSTYSEWSLGPDSSHSSRRSSRHPSERHAHLAALIHQFKLHTQIL